MADNCITLTAPLSGVLVALTEVPDPVFASKMVGDGVSIDPTSQSLVAPCAGKITLVHAASHALTVVHDSGIEVMMHIGLDTVALKGQGFKPKVKAGDTVVAGQTLIEFDADIVAKGARSLLTQIIVTPPERIESLLALGGHVQSGRDPVLQVRLRNGATAAAPTAVGHEVVSPVVTVPNPQGLHARPAAVLAAVAKRFKADTFLVRNADRANVKSVVSLMTMQVKRADKVTFHAVGSDAAEAVKALAEALSGGLGEDPHAPPAPTVAAAAKPAAPPPPDDPKQLHGVSASPGLAVGRIFQLRRQERHLVERAADAGAERRALQGAIDQAASELEALERRLAGQPNAAIFAAHRELLGDPDLTDKVWQDIAQGQSAAYAWQHSCSEQAGKLAALPDPLLSARANDVRDVRDRVLRLLLGEAPAPLEMPDGSLLVAEDLTPSETATLDRSKVRGFVTLLGGATSHVAILARSLDLPAIVAIHPQAATLPDGTIAILDAGRAVLRIEPSQTEMEAVEKEVTATRERRARQLQVAVEPAITLDGHRIEVVANLGDVAEAEKAVKMGAEGVGLLRSEFLFMGREQPPSEDEQAHAYGAIARALGPQRPLIIRTLDVGGDKPLPYLPIPHEDNPFLGDRGIRVMLKHEALLRTQMRAILRVARDARLMVMLPMVTNLSEFQAARVLFEDERQKLDAPPVPLGVMIEVPAAALTADTLAREAEFFSIGTNDLTQYTLAVDRGHPGLAAMADALHPAVLRLIRRTVRAAEKYQRMVGVCGGVAGDPLAVPLLVGLGVHELSVAVPAIPAVKAAIRDLSLEACRALAAQALELDGAAEVRALVGGR